MKTQYGDWPRKEKADNGFWYAFYRDAHGQPHRVSLKTKNENQANSRYQDLMEQVDRGVLHYSPRPKALPFSEMVDRYLSEGAGRLRPKSRERHEGCFKLHLVPYFKSQSIKAIGVKDVAAYIASGKRREPLQTRFTRSSRPCRRSSRFSFAMKCWCRIPFSQCRNPSSRSFGPTTRRLWRR